ncbi:UTP--glucose-1-phosphate uridylyltransferase [Streptomyces sp. NPDC059352]|uniref:UTP--glucose-1-phosphate uridylyltransferase n=1 Tax=Streptomyces sp. NPDC059352 TaxID=3346810 RepID=UPI0036935064
MVDKAVIPAAGIGSRLLPLSRALPKEMLPIGDMPVIEHTVRELAASGITEILIVVSGRKALVQQHFAPDAGLEAELRASGREELARRVAEVHGLARISFAYQDGPYGNGTPVLNAAARWPGETFVVLWPDDLFLGPTPRTLQLLDAHRATGAPVIALQPIDRDDAPMYGVPVVTADLGQGRMRVSGLVEKPHPAAAPSEYGAIGGYVVTPGVVDALRRQHDQWHEQPTGELYLTDALHEFAGRHPVYGQAVDGTWWDTGTIPGYLRAQLAYAGSHPGYSAALRPVAAELADRQSAAVALRP